MLKTGKVICPTCGGEVMKLDTIDVELDIASVILFLFGECHYCGKRYQWREEYTFAGYSDLEQAHDEGNDEPNGIDDECGFDTYEGCYTYDC